MSCAIEPACFVSCDSPALRRKRLEIVRPEHGPGPFHWFVVTRRRKYCVRGSLKKRNEAVSLIGERQYTLTKNAVAKLNMGVGVTKKAPTYAPESEGCSGSRNVGGAGLCAR